MPRRLHSDGEEFVFLTPEGKPMTECYGRYIRKDFLGPLIGARPEGPSAAAVEGKAGPLTGPPSKDRETEGLGGSNHLSPATSHREPSADMRGCNRRCPRKSLE